MVYLGITKVLMALTGVRSNYMRFRQQSMMMLSLRSASMSAQFMAFVSPSLMMDKSVGKRSIKDSDNGSMISTGLRMDANFVSQFFYITIYSYVNIVLMNSQLHTLVANNTIQIPFICIYFFCGLWPASLDFVAANYFYCTPHLQPFFSFCITIYPSMYIDLI